MSLLTYLRAAPKAELHLHLAGAIRPETVLRLAARHGLPAPADTLEGLRERFRVRDFRQFLDLFLLVCRCLFTAEDFERVTVELAEDLAAQNARYAEVTLSPGVHVLLFGVPADALMAGLERGRRRALQEYGVRLSWVLDLVRNPKDAERRYGLVTQLAIDHRAEGVVALGMAGEDNEGGLEPCRPFIERARAAGLFFTPRAGELVGPHTVRECLDVLGTDRIGHGVLAIQDASLVADLAARGVCLEVCPTSNVRLGVFPDYVAHPLRRLHDAGVPVTVSSDDPTFFHTTLSDELALLATAFGFRDCDVNQVDRILLNGVRHSFLPPAEKHSLLTAFQGDLAALKPLHLS